MADAEDAKEWFRSAAWADFIRWATEKHEFQDAYHKASGETASADSMERFVMWLTKEHWGTSEAPQRVRAMLAAAVTAAAQEGGE